MIKVILHSWCNFTSVIDTGHLNANSLLQEINLKYCDRGGKACSIEETFAENQKYQRAAK